MVEGKQKSEESLKRDNVHPVLKKNVWLHVSPIDGVMAAEGTVYRNRVNKSGSMILSLCNGKKTIDDIVTIVANRNGVRPYEVREMIYNFIAKATEMGCVSLTEEPTDEHGSITGNGDLWVPRLVALEITRRCDLRCKHCFISAGEPRERELDTGRWLQILSQLSDLGTGFITITGGEPFNHPEILRILQSCSEKFPKGIRVITNGYRIDEAVVNELSKIDIEVMQVSLDGCEKTHDWFRGVPGSFQKATRTIKLLAERGFNVEVAMCISDFNYHEIEKTMALAKKLGAKAFGPGKIVPYGRAQSSGIHTSTRLALEMVKKLVELKKKYHDDKFNVMLMDTLGSESLDGSGTIPTPKEGTEAAYEKNFFAFLAHFTKMVRNCGAGHISWYIRGDGKVTPCGMQNYVMGDLSFQDPREVASSRIPYLFHEILAPAPPICPMECLQENRCDGCMAHGFARGLSKDCAWSKQTELRGVLSLCGRC